MTHKRTHRSMRKRASIISKRRRTRGLHRAGGSLSQQEEETINFGRAFVLHSSFLEETWKQQNISITRTPTKNTVELLGKSFRIDKLRSYSTEQDVIHHHAGCHRKPMAPYRNDLCWSHRVDVLDADNRVYNIHFEEDPTDNVKKIMRLSPYPKNCLMQGMLCRKFHLLDSTTQPVAGGPGSWETMNCVLYETQMYSQEYKFEYTWYDKKSSILFSPTVGHALLYPIEDRTFKKQYRFDLYWDDGARHFCLAAPDENQKKAWISAFLQAGVSSYRQHPRNAFLGETRETHDHGNNM